MGSNSNNEGIEDSQGLAFESASSPLQFKLENTEQKKKKRREAGVQKNRIAKMLVNKTTASQF